MTALNMSPIIKFIDAASSYEPRQHHPVKLLTKHKDLSNTSMFHNESRVKAKLHIPPENIAIDEENTMSLPISIIGGMSSLSFENSSFTHLHVDNETNSTSMNISKS